MTRGEGERGHRPALELVSGPPEAVDAGASLSVRVRLSCSEGCGLDGSLVSADGPSAADPRLSVPDRGAEQPGVEVEVVLLAPAETGPATWTLTLPAHDVGEVPHDETTLSVTTEVVPHATSLAVWDVPSPTVGTAVSVAVGVKCSSGCGLGGLIVEVTDAAGQKLGDGTLSTQPRPDADGLHEARVGFEAPQQVGVHHARAYFRAHGLELPHEDCAGSFSFRALEPAEHVLTVTVLPRDLEAPLAGILLRAGGYEGTTDDRGVARIGVPTGTFELQAWRLDIEPVTVSVAVDDDVELEIEAVQRTFVDEDAEREWA